MPWLDPCGRPCDWLRSAYDTEMVFTTGDSPVSVRWYRSKDDQPWAPIGNLFVSGNWTERDQVAGDLGEQPGNKQWSNGRDVKDYPIQTGDPCSVNGPLIHGLPSGDTTGPWSAGVLGCCSASPFDCSLLADELLATITNLTGCSSLDQVVTLTRIDTCVWQGTATTDLGDALMTVGYAMGAWFRSMDCFTGDPTWSLISQQDSPLEVVWDVLDTTVCCSFSGTDSFRVTLTS